MSQLEATPNQALPRQIVFNKGLTATKKGENVEGSTGFYSVHISGYNDPLLAIDSYLFLEAEIDYHDPRIRVICPGQ